MGVPPRLRNGKTVAFRVLGKFATLCLLGLGLGLGSGHAWVTPARRLGDPWVTPGSRLGRIVEVPVFATKDEKGRVGETKKFNHKGHEGTQREITESPTSRVIRKKIFTTD